MADAKKLMNAALCDASGEDTFAHQQRMQRFTRLPVIQSLACREAWSISTADKMPIDIYALEHENRIAGCSYGTPGAAATLNKVVTVVPNAGNFAFHLESDIDNVCVLDIEPACPQGLKDAFCDLPYLYGEVSLSGQGLHLLMPYPKEILEKYPAALAKKKLKDAANGFEILFDHWITFTGIAIAPASSNADIALFDEKVTILAKAAKQSHTKQVDIEIDRPGKIWCEDYLLDRSIHDFDFYYQKTPEDFDGDMSTYEFAVIAFILRNLRKLQQAMKRIEKKASWDDTATAWLVYQIAQNVLEYREKHEQVRQNMPWLLYMTMRVMSTEETEKRPRRK